MTWLPFDLHPEYPPQGIPRAQLHARYGEEAHERLKRSFAEAGLVYNPPPDVVPNTMLALRLTELARDRGLEQRFHERLMHAYWEQAIDIGDRNELAALAGEAGLDAADVEAVMEGDSYRDRVLGSTAQAQSIGVTGVPAFLLDRRRLVLGAHPRPVFERVLEELQRSPGP